MRKSKLILTQSEKGGCGKTTIEEALVAGMKASGARVLVVDADDGNSGYIRRSGEGSAVPLPWSLGPDALPSWLSQHLGDHDTVAIDCGANLIASGAPVNEFLGELVGRVVEAGGSVVALAVASTNAPGTGRLAKQMREAYGDYGEVRLIRNDQDGSGAFSRSLGTLGMKFAKFPHIPPGIQAARLLSVRPLLDTLRDPVPGYTIAMACLAASIVGFLDEPAIADLLGPGDLTAIRSRAMAAPSAFARTIYTLKSATDDALVANQRILVARNILREAATTDRSDDAVIARSALSMLDAEAAHNTLIR